MRILFDTNFVLDLLLDRESFSKEATILFSKVELEGITGFLCANTVTTIYYLYSKVKGQKEAQTKIQQLLSLFSIANVNKIILESALSSKIKDYEDAVIEQSALYAGVEGIVTRNLKDFKYSKIKTYSPIELLKIISLTRTSRKSKMSSNKSQINHKLQITMNKTTPLSSACVLFEISGIGH